MSRGKLGNGATWRCDTIEVWIKGVPYSADELYSLFLATGYISELQAGAHLVITGGEPLLQQDQLADFLKMFRREVFIEVETNATFLPDAEFSPLIAQFNVSPKLANSGMDRTLRINQPALTWFAKDTRAIFKFVVTRLQDWQEIEQDFADPFGIPRHRIWLMPGAETRAALHEIQPLVAELCLTRQVNFSPRLQLEIWDRRTGI